VDKARATIKSRISSVESKLRRMDDKQKSEFIDSAIPNEDREAKSCWFRPSPSIQIIRRRPDKA